MIALGALTAACTTAPEVTAADMIHVHDLIVADGEPTRVATHAGLFEIRDGRAVAIADGVDDLMAAIHTTDGELLASGHPELGQDRLRVDELPPLLGTVVWEDGSWSPRALLGEADFHAFAEAGDLLLGADGTSRRLLASDDGGRTWTQRGEVELIALAVDPDDPDLLAGIGYDGALRRSSDGGHTWTTGGPEDLLDLAWDDGRLLAIDGSGGVLRLDGGVVRIAEVPEAAALTVTAGEFAVLLPPATVLTSTDGGRTWTERR